jgi:hypothetical protein
MHQFNISHVVHAIFEEKVRLLNFFSFVDVVSPWLMGKFNDNSPKNNFGFNTKQSMVHYLGNIEGHVWDSYSSLSLNDG